MIIPIVMLILFMFCAHQCIKGAQLVDEDDQPIKSTEEEIKRMDQHYH